MEVHTFLFLLQTCLLFQPTYTQTPLVHEDPRQDNDSSPVVRDRVLPVHTHVIGEKIKQNGHTVQENGTNTDQEYADAGGAQHDDKTDFHNKPQPKIRTVTVLHTPYVMKGPGSTFQGLVPDILQNLASRLGVTFDLYLAPDAKYGSRDVNGTWDGMMGDLVKRKNGDTSGAEMAAAPLTMTSQRQKVVSFLNPFKHGGLVGIVKKPYMDDYTETSSLLDTYFNVMQPLSSGVWFSILIGCIVVATLLWLLNLFNPNEWAGRYNAGRATEAAAESFSFTGSLWFAFTTLQWQGFDRMPRSSAAKVLSIFWFVFVSVTLLMYTASVVTSAFWASTQHGRDMRAVPFIDLGHLATANEELGYNYGMETSGATYDYLMYKAKGQEYDQMRAYWKAKGNKYLVEDIHEGIAKARQGKYVFITERLTAEFFVNQQPCDLIIIDKPVGIRAYGMALSQTVDKSLEEKMRMVILQMMETGELETLERKWFKSTNQCWKEKRAERHVSRLSSLEPSKPKQITLSMFWGPMIILITGIILCVVAFVIEASYYRYKGRYTMSNRDGGHRLGSGEDEFNG